MRVSASIEAELIHQSDGCYRVNGELVFLTVSRLLRAGRQYLPRHKQVILDLGGVTRCNMAGLALLIEWVRLLDAKDIRVRLIGLPDALTALAEICEVMPILSPYLESAV